MRCSILPLFLSVAIVIGLEDGSMQKEKNLEEFRSGDRGLDNPKTKTNQAKPNASPQATSDSTYTRVPKTSCLSRYPVEKGNVHPTLEKAKEVCSSDNGKCAGVWDCKCNPRACQNKSGFKLCEGSKKNPEKVFQGGMGSI